MKVLVVSLDTLRADRLGCLGGRRGLTPNIDAFAAGGALFERAYATDVPTQPSHTAFFTGRTGATTGIVSHFFSGAELADDAPWLPSLARAAGCRTGAVDHLFAMRDWFVRGYDDYMPPTGRSRAPAETINALAFPWLERHANGDFFLFVHYWDAHVPYVPPPAFLEPMTVGSRSWRDPVVHQRLRSRPTYSLSEHNLYRHLDDIPNLQYVADCYDAEVAYLDQQVGRLLDHLAALRALDDTVVVLFADHGEVMTEHDAWFDHAGLYESVVHVPLLMRGPGVPATRVQRMVALVDVLPTLVDLLDLPTVGPFDGTSLVPLSRGDAGGRHQVFLSECTWQAKRGVRTDRWKLIRTYDPGLYPRDGPELYDLVADPDEQVDVAGSHPEVVADLGRELDQWLSGRLGERPDPMARVIAEGLPAVVRLDGMVTAPTPPPPLPGESGYRSGDGTAAEPLAAEPLAADRPVADRPTADGAPSEGPAADRIPTEGPVSDRPRPPRGPGARDPHDGLARRRYTRRRRLVRLAVVPTAVVVAGTALGVTLHDVVSGPVQAAGVVQAATVAALNFATSGTVASLDVSVGQQVQAGQVLASQDTSALQAKLAADQAVLAAAQATQAADPPTSPAATATAQAQLAVERAQVAADQQALAGAEVVAPFTGVVAAVGGVVGEIDGSDGVRQPQATAPVTGASAPAVDLFSPSPQASTGSSSPATAPLVTLESLNDDVVVEVSAAQIGSVHLGAAADVTLPSTPGRHLRARVARIEPMAVDDDGSPAFVVDLALPTDGSPTPLTAAAAGTDPPAAGAAASDPAPTTGTTTAPMTGTTTATTKAPTPATTPTVAVSGGHGKGATPPLTGLTADVSF